MSTYRRLLGRHPKVVLADDVVAVEHAAGDVPRHCHRDATRWGMRDLSELTWVSPDFEIRKIGSDIDRADASVPLAKDIAVSGGETLDLEVPGYVDDVDIARP